MGSTTGVVRRSRTFLCSSGNLKSLFLIGRCAGAAKYTEWTRILYGVDELRRLGGFDGYVALLATAVSKSSSNDATFRIKQQQGLPLEHSLSSGATTPPSAHSRVISFRTLFTRIISLLHPNFESKPYQTFVIYTAFTIGAYLLNTFAVRLLPLVDRTAFFWSLAGIVVVSIVLLATASPEYQPASFVFGEFINETGWPNGVTFLLGLLQVLRLAPFEVAGAERSVYSLLMGWPDSTQFLTW